MPRKTIKIGGLTASGSPKGLGILQTIIAPPKPEHTREELEAELLRAHDAPHVGIVRNGTDIHIQVCDDSGYGPGVILHADGTYTIEYVFTALS